MIQVVGRNAKKLEAFGEKAMELLDFDANIIVHVTDQLSGDFEDYAGACFPIDQNGEIWIIIDLNQDYIMAYTLGHELIHARQIARGELDYENMMYRLDGIELDCSHLGYKKQPWEIEAESLDEFVFVECWYN
jgi:Zn-dependent peptidase ImmA (M78 family)